MGNRWWAAAAAGAAVALLAACGSSAPSTSSSSPTATPTVSVSTTPHSSSATVTIKTGSTSLGTVLTNSNGDTLYWFALDTSTTSACTGSCATYWPPVLGTPTAAPGTTLPHGFGTITRSNGQVQATYDGHPLYAYAGDTAPGQANGNDKNLSGGLWWAMTPSGTKVGVTPSASSSSSSSSYGGY